MNEEKKFWEYVRKMGYPTSPKGLKYGSKEKKELDELRWFFYMKKINHTGARIGWAAGSSLSRLAREYWDVNLAFIRVMEGEEAVIQKLSEIIKKNVDAVKIYAKDITENDIFEWIEEGGYVDIDDIVKSLKCIYDENNVFKCMYENYEDFFGDEMKMRITDLLEILEISEGGKSIVKKNFQQG